MKQKTGSMHVPHPLPFKGSIQKYAWGGYELLSRLTGETKEKYEEPWAELWLGGHPKGPGKSSLGTLDRLLAEEPKRWLGEAVAHRFEQRLPFLLKVLDVREMLSIQCHPTKSVAEKGFELENEKGIPLTAPNRNYRDQNHKPELGVALTDFYLLHGFRSEAEIRRSLDRNPGWEALRPALDRGGIKGIYREVMEMSDVDVNSLLSPLAKSLKIEAPNDKGKAPYWAARAFNQYGESDQHDRGIFSIYWLNLVRLRPGEGIFQAAGVPHAYLEGACVELMANSDNVLRGGLTVKHIDVPELLANLRFESVSPSVLHPQQKKDGWAVYPTPVPDFQLSERTLKKDDSIEEDAGPAIYFVLEGSLLVEGTDCVPRGNALLLPYAVPVHLKAEAKTKVFRASVGSLH